MEFILNEKGAIPNIKEKKLLLTNNYGMNPEQKSIKLLNKSG